MANKYQDIKILESTYKHLKKLKKLKEFKLEEDITYSELIDDMLEKEFTKFDDIIIKKGK